MIPYAIALLLFLTSCSTPHIPVKPGDSGRMQIQMYLAYGPRKSEFDVVMDTMTGTRFTACVIIGSPTVVYPCTEN